MRRLSFLASALALSIAGSAAAQGAGDLKSQCSSCHALEKPAAPSVERLWNRKGPDLWYAGAKFNRPVGFGRCTICEIRVVCAFLSQVVECFARFSKDIVFPGNQLGSEISALVRIHELLVFRGNIIAKIDLLTQRDSPEEHLIWPGVYPKRYPRFKPNKTGKQIFKSVINLS